MKVWMVKPSTAIQPAHGRRGRSDTPASVHGCVHAPSPADARDGCAVARILLVMVVVDLVTVRSDKALNAE